VANAARAAAAPVGGAATAEAISGRYLHIDSYRNKDNEVKTQKAHHA